MIKKLTLLAILVTVFSYGPSAFGATEKRLPTPQLQEKKSCTPIGKGAAMSAAARRIDSKVLSASLNMRARPPVYRVKVLTDSGRVRYIYVDACTGRLA
ncbi:PepSY domain-containing protein [Kangiella marina]|uniref:PepSY domain-containing protein n=1 Tax=Kangiella marina TaxID=1079178 RepID=A0ABP8IAE2_9GAMM